MLRGALAAAVTPLRDERLDVDAVGPYVDFLASHELDGVLVLGTTGEGVMFPPAHRRDIAGAFLEAARGRLQVAVTWSDLEPVNNPLPLLIPCV